ncbi:MAG: hypothetical protein HY235_30160 [Acidobacteria bacterium]|nr:hypothetical protein [Acidobacteriota bacterium]
MLRGVILAPDAELRHGVEARIADTGHVLLLRSFDHYLSLEELHRFHRAHAPQVLFLDIASNPDMLDLAAQLGRVLPGVLGAALHHQCDPALLMKLLHAGIREFLYPPFEKQLFLDAVARLTQTLRETPVSRDATDLLFAFLPAKAGCGCSTLAMNSAMAMTRALEGKVLLADFDLNCGTARFLLKLTNAFSVQDALEKTGELDEGIWSEIICPAGMLDVLASGPIQKTIRFETGAIRRMLEYAQRRYKAIVVDLSGNLEDYSLEILHESRRILMVLEPDLATVYLAREKLRFLRTLDLEDRVSVILNRWHRDACLSIADIESVIGLPVQYTLGNDGEAVYRALLGGTPVDGSSDLGKELARLAIFLSEARTEKAEVTPKRRMVEYFSLLPARYSLLK